MDTDRPDDPGDLPLIDVAPLVAGLGRTEVHPDEIDAARRIDRACRTSGFFLVTGHAGDQGALEDLDRAARAFFALETDDKAKVAMATGGRAWRGWFPEGGELTSGVADRKEGLYVGRDLPADDPRVLAGTPLHGPNRLPDHPPALRPAIDRWMAAMEQTGHALARGVSLGLGLAPDWMDRHLTTDPTILFRIFRYPAVAPDDVGWGVGEHTDYGLLTLLAHDGTPGLEVWSGGRWIEVPATPGALIVNLGDMLERMTGGRYRSTPHRVRHGIPGGEDRLSFPFFFDPGWDARVQPVPDATFGPDDLPSADDDARVRRRWDGAAPDRWEGTYGAYLTAKVAKVFPQLGADVGVGPG
ncbi:MAG: 2-oxoglutarate and iron-dependent oxygenase domain-containing protein [Acidimicrobiales bacterium]